MSEKSLIIGGSGFVGTSLINILDKKRTLNLDKNQSSSFNELTCIGNILYKDQIRQYFKDIETVVLLAAEHRDDVTPVSLYYDVNVGGTKNVLDIMDEFKIKKIIFTSSVAVYGLDKNNPDENHELDPFNHYGKSKLMAEEILIKWFKNNKGNGKSLTIVRPTVIFGQGNRGNVYNLMKQISSNKFIMIGNGSNKKSMAYVENIASFIKFLIEKKQNNFQVYNYVDKPDYNMNELVFLINKYLSKKSYKFKLPHFIGLIIAYTFDFFAYVTKKKLPFSRVRLKKFCSETTFDSTKKSKIFNPPFTIESALKKTILSEFQN